MRNFINILEAIQSPANALIQWAEANKPEGMSLILCNNAWDESRLDADAVGIQWIERTTGEPGIAGNFLSQLCSRADTLGVTLELGVQYTDDDDDDEDDSEADYRDHHDLVFFYRRFGFEETGDDGEFINMRRDPEN